MSKNSCEKCGKEFNSKSHYTQHQKRKMPCVSESKIKELIDKSVEEKLTKLNVVPFPPCLSPSSSVAVVQPPTEQKK